jgi:streptomycin 6-kinase
MRPPDSHAAHRSSRVSIRTSEEVTSIRSAARSARIRQPKSAFSVVTGAMFDEYIRCWRLVADGEPVLTATSGLLPVRFGELPAILKVAILEEEKRGGRLMRWWDGRGAAAVLAFTDDAVLMERARNQLLLAELARSGRDDEASHIICTTTAKLHMPRACPKPLDLVPLERWFEPLYAAGKVHGGLLRRAADLAAELLAAQREVTVLHGDIHHGNILDFGPRGWLAIDPKGLWGERTFDHANILCNPDQQTATLPGRLSRQVRLIASMAHLEPKRLLEWVVAWAGLSAAFLLEDGFPADHALQVGELAVAELGN